MVDGRELENNIKSAGGESEDLHKIHEAGCGWWSTSALNASGRVWVRAKNVNNPS
jgi:hypothetical protein